MYALILTFSLLPNKENELGIYGRTIIKSAPKCTEGINDLTGG